MNNQERNLQTKKLQEFDRLSALENEIQLAIELLKDDAAGPFTGNFSRVKPVVGITIEFPDDVTVDVRFPALRGLSGWKVSSALTPLLLELRDQIWKDKEKL